MHDGPQRTTKPCRCHPALRPAVAPLSLDRCPDMKSLAVVAAALLVTVGAANAGEIVINPKAPDRAVVLTIRGDEVVKASVIAIPVATALPPTVGAANAGEIVINPKAPDRAVVLTITGDK